MVTQATDIQTTNSIGFVDMPSMSGSITLSVPSMLVITISAQTWVATTGNYIYWRALVDAAQANPVSSAIIVTGNPDYGATSFTFYLSAAAGTHTVSIQWRTYVDTSVGNVGERTLTVMAFPT
jgi:hypothetical protein